MNPHVFVYGSLLSGLHNHPVLARAGAELIGQAQTVELFHMLDMGQYPGVMKDPKSYPIKGEVYRVKDMDPLDHLEGYPLFYDRMEIQLDSGIIAWIYFLPTFGRFDKFAASRTAVPDGDWRKHFAAKAA